MQNEKVSLYGSPWRICADCGALYLEKKGHSPALCETVREFKEELRE
jgi:hypothetical protein